MNDMDRESYPSQLLTFRLGAREFGVSVEFVADVLRWVSLIAPPDKAPDILKGFIPIKGRAVPLIDVHRKMDLEVSGEPSEQRIISLRRGDFLFCLMADDITGVLGCDSINRIIREKGDAVAGRVQCEGGMNLSLLDPKGLVSPEMTRKLRKLAKNVKFSPGEKDSSRKLPGNRFREILMSLRESYEESVVRAPDTSPGKLVKYLVVCIGVKHFAIPVEYIREVFRSFHITPVPRTSPRVLGVINLRGEIISVVSLYEYLGMEPPNTLKNPRLLVTRNTPFTTSVPVDSLELMAQVEQDDISPWQGEGAYLGTIPVRGEDVPVIDLAAVLREEAVEETIRS